MKDCVFCKMAEGKISVTKIYENDNFFSIFDAAPQVKGHALVISKKHFKTTLDLPNSLGLEFFDAIKKTSLKIIEQEKAEGFNLINNNFESAGQTVKHFHFHIIPRRKDDGCFLSLKKK
jgi:histidine triad (HIT) family protein